MTIPLLPKLKEAHNISLTGHGTWAPEKLTQIGDSLWVEEINNDIIGIDSIPDIWARPLLFQMALFDDDHLLHKRVLAEWRGLLAMVALKEIRLINKLTAIKIANISQGNSAFEKALTSLMPKGPTLADGTGWDSLYVFLYGDQPIGMTSPTTLVCTAAGYLGRINNLEWFDGRYLKDPIKYLNDDEKKEMAGWLNRLIAEISGFPGANNKNPFFDSLLGLLRAYLNDLGISQMGIPDISANLLNINHGIVSLIDKPINAPELKAENSFVRLVPDSDKKPSTDLLILGENMWYIENPCDLKIISHITMAHKPIGGWGTDHKRLRDINLPPGTEWRTAEDLFTAYLFVAAGNKPFPGSPQINAGDMLNRNNRNYIPILPIAHELLDYLKAEEINQRFRYEVQGDKVIVSLSLPLAGPDNQGRDYIISKEYSWKDTIKEVDNPLIVVWPNFKRPTLQGQNPWKAYYSFYRGNWSINEFYAKPFVQGEDGDKKYSHYDNRGNIQSEYHKMEKFPEAMVCTARVEGQDTAAGFIVLSQPADIKPQDVNWKVGIDFGTTSTSVYYSNAESQNAPKKPLVYSDLYLQITDVINKNLNLIYPMWNEFFPYDYEVGRVGQRTEFLSLFASFKAQITGNRIEPICEGHIRYINDPDRNKEDRAEDNQEEKQMQDVVGDLKWSYQTGDNIRSTAFLEQLCLQISAQAASQGVSGINWSFSFPTAFPLGERERFIANYNNIYARCNQVTGMGQVSNNKTESEASAAYFIERMGGIRVRGFVSVDIGGGTSDIAYWQQDQQENNSLRLQTSFKFAGRDIMLETLRKNPAIFNKFGIDQNTLGVLQTNAGDKNAFYVRADAAIIRNAQNWFKELPAYAQDPMVKDFISLINLGISGIIYYIGLLLRYSSAQEGTELKAPDIFVGGNGGNLLHWMQNGQYTNTDHPANEGTANRFLKEMFKSAAGFDTNGFVIKLSDDLKAEAAIGLLSNKSLNIENGSPYGETVVAGEDYIVLQGEKESGWDGKLSPEIMKAGIKIAGNMGNLRNYVEAFKKAAGRHGLSEISVTEYQYDRVQERVDQKLADLSRSDLKDISPEPLFMLGIKILLEMKADEWAEQYKTQ